MGSLDELRQQQIRDVTLRARIGDDDTVVLRAWFDVQPAHRGTDESLALFLSRRGVRMRVRAIRYVVAELGDAANLVYECGPDTGSPGSTRTASPYLRHPAAAQRRRHRHVAVVGTFLACAELWRQRRLQPNLIAQPEGQWPSAKPPRVTMFVGYKSHTIVPPKDLSIVVSPRTQLRLQAAKVMDGDHPSTG